MPRERFDVIVAGVGATGSAACFHLARRGVRVLGLDADSTPNENGSSGGQSRMIRYCYYEHPDYVPLLRRSYELWDELCAVTSQPILRRTGGLYVGDPNGPSVAGSRQSAQAHGLSHEMLSHGMLKERFPQFRVPDGYEALYEPNAGMVTTATAIAAHLNLAIDFGGEIHAHEPVVAWREDDRGLLVETTKATYAADRLVVAAGSWTSDLLPDLGVPLQVTRQVLGWVWPRNPEPFRVGRFPVWAVDDGAGSLHYGFPLIDGLPGPLGLKVAHHRPGPPTTATSIDRRVRDADESAFRYSTRELLALAALEAGDRDESLDLLRELASDGMAPEPIRRRAGELLAALGAPLDEAMHSSS